ncbi:ABC transporter ATP-binding protein [Methanocorpusculum sp. MG]|uniref:Molybdate/tungstate import ATP-binding protein WtpC n=1 Tax=Methanocorpusculum petauri TaxID=3002863 RepID=A0ABT4IG06_9EURY|nr:ABC transporter ATP-binding protein [Methanocorpusculum petauri]MCZ0860299.1 ABC transporter ATP-binding protein [Methanocorpusculum petauri]MDE2444296.1 ABC transporter ATP-binding protein [Methanocorpusculum sp.]
MLNGTFAMPLRDFDLDVSDFVVNDGETLALIGENGAGKSTVLRILSGLLKPVSGRVVLNDRVLFDSGQRVSLAPEDRQIGYMFQNYALFPHMTVRENIAYGLKVRRVLGTDVDARVGELCERMGVAEIADQLVTRLSGGQRQRTALARALAPSPELLLLDEPLSALDVRTQEQMRRELASVIRSERIPCIIVTHSIVDALAVADRIAVIERGVIVACGAPEEIIHNPANGFVSSFSENLNLFRGKVVVSRSGVVCVDVAGIKIRATTTLSGTVSVGIRPEELILSRERFESSAINSFRGIIARVEDTGLYQYVYVDIGITLAAAVTRQSMERLHFAVGDEVTVTFKATAVQVFV